MLGRRRINDIHMFCVCWVLYLDFVDQYIPTEYAYLCMFAQKSCLILMNLIPDINHHNYAPMELCRNTFTEMPSTMVDVKSCFSMYKKRFNAKAQYSMKKNEINRALSHLYAHTG